MSTDLAPNRVVSDFIAEYDEKCAAIPSEIKAFNAAIDRAGMAATVAGTYVGTVVHGNPRISEREVAANLLKSGWAAIYARLGINEIASASDKRKFKMALENPAPLTMENVRATLGDYLIRPRFHVLRGLAECFVQLDPAYKSHSNVRIGVKGLPKRVILSHWGEYSSGWGRDRFSDIVNALAAYRHQPMMTWDEWTAINAAHRGGNDAVLDGRPIPNGKDGTVKPPNRGLWVRKFQNGNAHVFFDDITLTDINKALAEFYGEVLPDAEEDGPVKPRKSTAVSKDLQYYPTPQKVVEKVLDEVGVYKPNEYRCRDDQPVPRVLEPSCGCGRFLDEIAKRKHRVYGIEVDAVRAAQARAKGHSVLTANFLETVPSPDFDFVVLNPPFYGRHYVKHVQHALRFLKPGGKLVSVLPATAWYDHGELKGRWHDLPVASFAESGTNIPTGFLIMGAA